MRTNRPVVTWLIALTIAVLHAHIANGQDTPPPTGGEAPEAAPADPDIAGTVVDADGAPVEHAIVVVCDQATGLPIGRSNGDTFIRVNSEGQTQFDDWLAAATGADGAFRFFGLKPGTYRLVVQSFPDVEPVRGPLDVNGLVIRLRGVADSVQVPSPEAKQLVIKPLGTGTFVYHRGAGNNDWYLFLSTGRPTADPVLGPLGWKGRFLTNAIGWARMPYGQIIVRGLPEQTVFFTVFANDNNPGFGAGAVYAWSQKMSLSDENVVAGWSDARHDPPERLRPLCERVRTIMGDRGPAVIEELLFEGREELREQRPKIGGFAHLFATAQLVGPLDREVSMPGGGTATVADLMAATAYVQLQRQLARAAPANAPAGDDADGN